VRAPRGDVRSAIASIEGTGQTNKQRAGALAVLAAAAFASTSTVSGNRSLPVVSKNREKSSCGAQNCNFPSFLPQEIPAKHLHISGTLRIHVAMCLGFWVTSPNFLVTTLNYRCIGARGARGKRFADRYGLGFGFWSSREGWVWGFGVRPKTHAHARPGRGVKIYTLHATRRSTR
jgi:hypothetical protein